VNRPDVELDQVMGAQPDPGFARALAPRAFEFPRDYGAHPEYATEWWYLTGNLHSDSGRRFGYQFTLFRVGLRPGKPAQDSAWRANQVYMGHIAISDIAGGKHYSDERFARAAAGLAGAHATPFEVWLGPWSLRGGKDLFPLTVTAQNEDMALSLRLTAGDKPLVLQGDQGLSRKSATPGNASYYYSFTRLPTRGELRIGDAAYSVQGDSWMDREWSTSALDSDQVGWDWFALQLDDGRELMFYRLRDRQGGMHPFSRGSLVDRDGRAHSLLPAQVQLTPRRYWQAEDGTRYPVEWRLQVPDHGLDLEVKALLDDQLMDHSVRYWEGAVGVSGSARGKGYLELSGYAG
jgi:predicted secreted hydrolase